MRVLFVDDNQSILAALRRNLRKRFEIETAESGEEGLRILGEGRPFAAVVSDMKMHGMSGIEFLERAANLVPRCVRVMLTGNADQQTAIDAVNRGKVSKILCKPCSVEELARCLDSAIIECEQGQGAGGMLEKVEGDMLENTVGGCVKLLCDVLGMVAPFALGRGQRLQACLLPVARMAGIGPLWELRVASLLSSIGYTSVPDSLIRKIGEGDALTDRERKIVRDIPMIGYELIAAVPKLENVAKMVKYQRKRFDGGGFPEDSFSGNDIPAGSRLLKIIEDRLELEKDGIVKLAAYSAMSARVGHYDTQLLDLCFKCFPSFLGTTISSKKAVLKLGLGSLKPGQIIVSDITTSEGLLLVESGNQLTTATLQRIRNYATLEQVSGPFFVQGD